METAEVSQKALDRLFVAIVCVLATGVVLALIGRDSLITFFHWEQAAGWVQAVGSIAAILVGAGAVWWQVGRQARAQSDALREEQIRRLKIVGAALFHCRVIVEQIQDEPAFPAADQLRDLRAQLTQLRSIPPLDFPDWRALHGVVYAQGTFEGHFARIEEADRVLTRRAVQDREAHLNVVLHGIELAEELVSDALVERSATLEPITMALPSGRILRTRGL